MILDTNKNTQFVTLEDKRKLCFAEWGDNEGIPVFMFSGFPNSRLDGELVHQDAKRLGLHVFTIDRPGIGRSDFQPNRKILDWSDDICEFADHLNISKFLL